MFIAWSLSGAYDAQKLVLSVKDEIGIEILDFPALVYVASLDEYVTEDKVPAGEKPLSISGTKFRAMMNSGEAIPEWFSHPDVIKILRVRDWRLIVKVIEYKFDLFVLGLAGGVSTAVQARLCIVLHGFEWFWQDDDQQRVD